VAQDPSALNVFHTLNRARGLVVAVSFHLLRSMYGSKRTANLIAATENECQERS
jgi:hypothetical protein